MRQGPLRKSYAAAVILVVCCLVPFLSLTAAVFPLLTTIAKSLDVSRGLLETTVSLSTAGYAVGTVLAVQFATRLPARRMLVVYVSGFFVTSVLTAWSPNADVFVACFIAQGLFTSLMLIAAVPPLIVGWSPKKMPYTGLIMNLAIFGAVAVGPTAGAAQAVLGGWRPLFAGVAAVAFLAVVFALLTFEDAPPSDTSAPWDFVAVILAVVGCGAGFFGAGVLESNASIGVNSLVPLIGGAVAVAYLVVNQFRKRQPLMPVRQLATLFPVAGITIAMSASASSFGLMELVLLALRSKVGLEDMALLFLPEFAAAVVTAVLFAVLFRTRYTTVMAFAGLVMLAAAAVLLLHLSTGGNLLVAAGTFLIGLGVGASVAPALFLAGFSLRSDQVQRVFALVELLRGVTAFLVAPILIFLVAALGGGTRAAGIEDSVWICLGLVVVGFVTAGFVLWRGGARLQSPDIARWQQEDEPAWESPPIHPAERRDYDRARREEARHEEPVAVRR